MTFAETLNLVWPLAFVLVALLVLRKVESDFRPVVVGIVNGLASNAQQKASVYAMCCAYVAAASLQSLGDVARQFEWVHVEAFAKVVQPGVVAAICFFRPSPTQTASKTT